MNLRERVAKLSPRFHWGISTLGCPQLSFEEASRLASDYGIRSLELRALDNEIDLLKHWRTSPPNVVSWQTLLASRDQQIVALDTPCALLNPGDSLMILSEFAEWAERLNVPYLRLFDGGRIGVVTNEPDLARATEFWERWQDLRQRRRWRTELLIETHDAFCNSRAALQWIEHQRVAPGLIWDVHHTWRHGHERLDETWLRLQPYVRHIHIKDSREQATGVQHLKPGLGDVPFEQLFRLLEAGRYQGVVCLEFERWWRPEIPALDECLDACVALRW